MAWKIIKETKDAITFQEQREDAYVVETISRDLVKHIIKSVRIKIKIKNKLSETLYLNRKGSYSDKPKQ